MMLLRILMGLIALPLKSNRRSGGKDTIAYWANHREHEDWGLELIIVLLVGVILCRLIAPAQFNGAVQQAQQALSNVVGGGSSDATGFEDALQFTLKWEGNTCENHPNDIGGLTCKGILDSEYREWRKANGLSDQSVTSMTDEEMKKIYRGYWDRCKAGDRPAPLSITIFDSCVNFDASRIGDWFENLPSDPKQAALTVMERRIAYRHQRVQEAPDQQVFLQGWLNRDNDLVALINNYQIKPQSPNATTPTTGGTATVDQQKIAFLQIGSQVCTGFMIGPSAMLTAGHCFRESRDGVVQIKLEGRQTTGRLQRTVTQDIALVSVDGTFSYFPGGTDAATGTQVTIPGYPLGNWNVFSGTVQQNTTKVATNSIVKGGASGAPVLVSTAQGIQWVGVTVGGEEPQATIVPRSRIGL